MKQLLKQRPSITVAISAAIISAAGLAGCGDDDERKKSRPLFAKVAMLDGESGAVAQNFRFFDAPACLFEPESGLLTGEFNQDGQRLQFSVRDFDTYANREYSCLQPANNVADELGDFFVGCAFDLQVPSDLSGQFDRYAMHRDTSEIRPFTYQGDCQTTIDARGGSLTGSFSCSRLAQTYLRGRPRNPVSSAGVAPDVERSFAGEFGCKEIRRLDR